MTTLHADTAPLRSPRHLAITVLGAALLLAAVPVGGQAQEIVEVHASPESLTLVVGQRERLFFSAFDAEGNLADQPTYRLGTSNVAVARVEPDGTVVGVSPGETTLVVRAGRGSTNVRVVVAGDPRFTNRTSIDEPGVRVATTAGMSRPGGATGLAGDPTASVRQVVVSPPPSPDPIEIPEGRSRRFRVRPLGGDSLPTGVRVTWSLSDSAVARFDAQRGVLVARTPGMTDLVARVPGVDAIKWRIAVTRLHPAITRDRVALVVGERVTLEALWRDAAGRPVGPLPAARWSSSDPSVAVIDSAGTVSGMSPGRSLITVVDTAGERATARVWVVGEMLLSSRGPLGEGADLYQVHLGNPPALWPVIVDSATNLFAVRSPSRDAIVFASDKEGLYDIYRADPDGGNIVRLTDAAGHQTQPIWSPDGKSILFTSTRTSIPQVFAMAPDGSDVRQLTRGDSAAHSPAISPDGATLAFVRGRGTGARVFLMRRDGQNLRPAGLAEANRFERAPGFFPNGDLAAVVQIGDRATAVVRRDAATGARVPLITSDDLIRSFAISRDGRFLAVVIESNGDRSSRTKLLLIDLTSRRSSSLSVPLAEGEHVASPSF